MGCVASSKQYAADYVCDDPYRPNVKRIEAICHAETAVQICKMLSGGALIDEHLQAAVKAIWDRKSATKRDRACVIDYCVRHGGVNTTNARRFLNESLVGQGTNRCSNSWCRDIGHQAPKCPYRPAP